MASFDVRKGIFLPYSDLVELPGLPGWRPKEERHPEGEGLLIPYGINEKELEDMLAAAGWGYEIIATHAVGLHIRLFGMPEEYRITFWSERGKLDHIVITALRDKSWQCFRRVYSHLRGVLGRPLQGDCCGPLGFLLMGSGAYAEWYVDQVEVEHRYGASQRQQEHTIRVRYLG